ncbi:MAG: type VI secretion system baseplate subunit TssF [Holosporales bacterium]
MRDSNFIDYYQRELSYLRHSGARFAKDYPKVAKRLDLSNVASSDPHVERLLESFAFLTARLQRDIDDIYPRISTALLEVLYPQLTRPLPSTVMICFDHIKGKGKLTEVTTIPRGTALFTRSDRDEICRFMTSYDVDVAPMTLSDAQLMTGNDLEPRLSQLMGGTAVIRLTLKSTAGPFSTQNLSHLRLYLNGMSAQQNQLYEALLAGSRTVVLETDGDLKPIEEGLSPVGFEEEEALLPYDPVAHPAYRLIQEYFLFPQKFMFLDIHGLENLGAHQEAYVYLNLDGRTTLNAKDIGPETFRLGCTPAVNLFSQVSEPIRLDERRHEYRLVADQRREKTTEVHSIKRVYTTQEGETKVRSIAPYFSYTQQQLERDENAYWMARRTPALREDLAGSDMYLSLVDLDFNPQLPATKTLYAELLCTNRDLAHAITAGTSFDGEGALPACTITSLTPATLTLYPSMEGASQWRLISHLSLNHLSLSRDPKSLEALKEILMHYGSIAEDNAYKEINGIVAMDVTPTSRRVLNEAWRGFVSGHKVKLTFDLSTSQDSSPYLFASLLNHFFNLYAAANSFVELEVYRANHEGVWRTWQPRIGSRQLL